MTASASSSQGCGTAPDECTVTQTGCKVSLSCPNFYTSTEPTTIDANDKGTFAQSYSFGGVQVDTNCALSFVSATGKMAIDCQLTAGSGGGADCIVDGTKK